MMCKKTCRRVCIITAVKPDWNKSSMYIFLIQYTCNCRPHQKKLEIQNADFLKKCVDFLLTLSLFPCIKSIIYFILVQKVFMGENMVQFQGNQPTSSADMMWCQPVSYTSLWEKCV